MIRLVSLLKRRPELSREEFVAHWREVHGPLVRSRLGQHLLGYEQHDVVDGKARWDGVAILTFPSRDAFDAFITDPVYAAEVAPDEERFLDRASVAFVLTGDVRTII